LIKYTANKAPLTELAGVQFHYWDEDAEGEGYDQWIIEYIDGFFKYVGGISWSDRGPPEIETFAPETIALDEGESLHLWSQQLGGSVIYRGGDSFIIYNTEEVVSTLEADLTFSCYDRCTKSGLSSSDLSSPDWDAPYTSPFQESMGGTPTPVTYRFDKDEMKLYKVVGGVETAVIYPTGVESETHQWGIRSGHLVESTEVPADPYDIYNPDEVEVFYEWEIGPNNWNKVIQVVATSNGAVQTFDKPIEFSYTHSETNDRGDDDTYAGQRFLLSYQGDGQLHGIPFEAKVKDEEGKEREEGEEIGDDHHVRWYPQFNLNDGTILGATNQYVVKAIDIEQMMQEEEVGSVCASLDANFDNLGTLPSGLASTHNSDIATVGETPTLTGLDAIPKVVGGEVQVSD
jgi:hypothetical protein